MKSKEQAAQKVTMLQKISFLFDKKQKIQCLGLGILILIGGLLETLGVSMMLPLMNAIMEPEKLMKKEIVRKLMSIAHIETADQLIMTMLAVTILLFVVKNSYLLFQTYIQNTFVARNRNRMISRVMREFLNRPYEEYLGADIPTVFRLTDSDIPNAFQLILVSIQLVTEVVVSACLCVVLLVVSPLLAIFLVVIFLGMTIILFKLLKPRLNKIGRSRG